MDDFGPESITERSQVWARNLVTSAYQDLLAFEEEIIFELDDARSSYPDDMCAQLDLELGWVRALRERTRRRLRLWETNGGFPAPTAGNDEPPTCLTGKVQIGPISMSGQLIARCEGVVSGSGPQPGLTTGDATPWLPARYRVTAEVPLGSTQAPGETAPFLVFATLRATIGGRPGAITRKTLEQ